MVMRNAGFIPSTALAAARNHGLGISRLAFDAEESGVVRVSCTPRKLQRPEARNIRFTKMLGSLMQFACPIPGLGAVQLPRFYTAREAKL